MPAFELYKLRYNARREGDQENSDSSNNHSDNGGGGAAVADSNSCGAADPFDNVEFGWNLHDADREMQRQLCLDPRREVPSVQDVSNVGPTRDLRPWFRLTSVKQPQNSYGKSPTYPFRVVVPNAASDELLEESMTARSHARFPAVSFVHLGTGAVLARASQPLRKSPGLRRDGDLCYMLTNSGYHAHNAEPKRDDSVAAPVIVTSGAAVPPPSLFDAEEEDVQSQWFAAKTRELASPPLRRPRKLLVADCRPRGAAYAHYGMGAGYESGATHDFCEVKFHGIENMHSVMDSFTKLKALVQQFNGKQPKDGFLKQLHDTNWLCHIQRVLMCSSEIAEALDCGDSSLVHCTDGWDRTPQCTATAMLLLDPFYRTIVGFGVLVEKEFCSFGHKFAERCGHQVRGDTSYAFEAGAPTADTEGQSSSSSSSAKLQLSPIFVQWIDVVFQVLRQFPRHFEFTPRLLEYLSEEVYSCLYGTFLCNGEKERMFEGVRLSTPSIWTYLVRAAAKERSGEAPLYFVNDTYDSETAWQYISKQRGSGIHRLSPNCSSKRLVFWESFYLRHDGDSYTSDVFNELRGVKKRVVFQKDWEHYFDRFVKDSCTARKKEVEEMRLLQENFFTRCLAPSVASVLEDKGNSKTCYQCRQKLGIFSSREQCRGCNVVMCGSCATCLDKQTRMCRECQKRHEWNSH